MRPEKRQIKLGLSMRGLGYHASAWRQPGVPAGGDIDYNAYLHVTRVAERGLFDMVFLADYVALRMNATPAGVLGRTTGMIGFEPLTLLSALAPATRNVGLVATVSTTFQAPYHIARSFASLDHLSGGRAGWNVVTSFQDDEARNFGAEEIIDKAARYAKAKEALDVVAGLWDSWDDDAFPRDAETGVYFDPARLRILNHEGAHFRTRGPLNVPRTPQGRPIVVQAGASPEGQELAAETADVVYAAQNRIDDAKAFYASLKGRMPKYGRDPTEVKIMPGLLPVIGRSEQEARDRYHALQESIDPIVGLGHLANYFGDLSGYDLDGPVPDLRGDRALMSRGEVMLKVARRNNLSIRQLYQTIAIGNAHNVVVGTVAQVADVMEEWMEAEAADGFNILPALSPSSVEEFVEQVVPELQRRGLYRKAYEGPTMRENLGLSFPRPRLRGGAVSALGGIAP
jgi:FMN-dependent oxidoreductase (nitrilotriacetate monooxygenase family)